MLSYSRGEIGKETNSDNNSAVVHQREIKILNDQRLKTADHFLEKIQEEEFKLTSWGRSVFDNANFSEGLNEPFFKVVFISIQSVGFTNRSLNFFLRNIKDEFNFLPPRAAILIALEDSELFEGQRPVKVGMLPVFENGYYSIFNIERQNGVTVIGGSVGQSKSPLDAREFWMFRI